MIELNMTEISKRCIEIADTPWDDVRRDPHWFREARMEDVLSTLKDSGP